MGNRIITRFIKPIFLLLSALLLSACKHQAEAPAAAVDTSNYPVVTLSIDGVQASTTNNTLSIPEEVRQVFITATLSKTFDEQVIFLFEYNSLNSSAQFLTDFQFAADLPDRDPRQPANSFEVVFNPGITEVSFTYLTLQNDNFYETGETVSFWVRPLLNSVINLPLHTLTKLPYIQLLIEESKLPPQIKIGGIKIGTGNTQSALTEITVKENQSLELVISTVDSVSITDTLISFSLIPDAGTIEGIDYEFPFALNKISPTDTSSDFILPAEASTLTIALPIYSKPIEEAPKRFTFTLTTANNDATISNSNYYVIVNILDDGNNGFNLSDTGITKCYDESKIEILCTRSDFPNQDGTTADQTTFLKYTTVNIAPDTTPPLVDQSSWDCVYDSTTGLLWEVIKTENIIDFYTWYDENPTTNGGSSGVQVEGEGNISTITGSTLEHTNSLNSSLSQLCGVGNASLGDLPGKWRLPKLNELLSIMNFETPSSSSLFLDNSLFNVTPSDGVYFWTSSPSAISKTDAWCVTFTKVIADSIKLCDKKGERPAIMVSTVKIIPQ